MEDGGQQQNILIPVKTPEITAAEQQADKVLSIFYENMRSVVNVRKELRLSTMDEDYDIITITETWLKYFHLINEFICDTYQVFRKDRIDSTIEKKNGEEVFSLP